MAIQIDYQVDKVCGPFVLDPNGFGTPAQLWELTRLKLFLKPLRFTYKALKKYFFESIFRRPSKNMS